MIVFLSTMYKYSPGDIGLQTMICICIHLVRTAISLRIIHMIVDDIWYGLYCHHSISRARKIMEEWEKWEKPKCGTLSILGCFLVRIFSVIKYHEYIVVFPLNNLHHLLCENLAGDINWKYGDGQQISTRQKKKIVVSVYYSNCLSLNLYSLFSISQVSFSCFFDPLHYLRVIQVL